MKHKIGLPHIAKMMFTALMALLIGEMTARDNARWVNAMIGTDLSDAPTMWGN